MSEYYWVPENCMTTLREKLEQAIAFDEAKAAEAYQNYPWPMNETITQFQFWRHSARWQHQQLEPLMKVMIECVEALEKYGRLPEGFDSRRTRETLAKLEKLVER